VLCERGDTSESYDWQINTDRIEAYDSARILARILANEIRSWLDNSSSTQPRDILILIRKRDKFTEHLVRSLKNNNIPVSGLDRIKLSENIVVKDLIALGSFILLPHDDYNLSVLLKSPIVNVDEERLFRLSQRSGLSLWQSLKNFAQQDNELLIAYNFLNEFLLKGNVEIYKLYSNLLDVKKIRQSFISRFGIQINEVLDEFLNICLEYEKAESVSLHHFISWFSSSEIEVKSDVDSQANLVRIMTVHASKGLQAKTVILADTMSIPGSVKQVVWSEDFNLPLYNGNSQNNNQLYNETKLSLEEKSLQEYYRLLYVAMTRAQEKLIVCGSSSYSTINDKSWYSVVKAGLQDIGKVEVCNSIGGYEVINNPQSESSLYFYSNSLEKIVLGDKLRDIYKEPSEEVGSLENILPDYVLERPTSLPMKKFSSASSSIVCSPTSKTSYINLGTLIHKILEIGINSSADSAIPKLIEIYSKNYDLVIDSKVANNLQNLIKKLHSLFRQSYEIFPEVSLAAEYNKNNLIGTIDLLLVSKSDVVVIDYKTSSFKDSEEIPIRYITQLAVYRHLVSILYSNKEIKCFVVSSVNGEFFEIAESVLKDNFTNRVI
jgi:ATP-dependent helicase/nuclease subunit A